MFTYHRAANSNADRPRTGRFSRPVKPTGEDMPHYVVIEPESGFVWEEAAADSPEAACLIIDEKLGDARAWYRDVGTSQHDIHNSYFVYEAPADWVPVTDGQDPSEIERVEKLPFVARVKYAARTW